MSPGQSTTGKMESLGSTSSSLLKRVKQRDAESWRRLVALYGPIVFLWCRQSGLQGHDAADVVQETFVAVARHVARFHRDRPGDSFQGWLWTITRNKIRDWAHQREKSPVSIGGSVGQEAFRQIPDLHPDASVPLDGQPGAFEQRALALIQAEFEPRTWQAFWQMTIDGRSAAEIAADLGMTTRAVRQAKYRVLRRLRQELEDLLE